MSDQPRYRQPSEPWRDPSGGADEPTRAFPAARDDAYRDPRYDDVTYGDARRPPDPRAGDQRPRERPLSPAEQRRRDLDAGALWSGGLVTAVVAALVALAGIIVVRGILHIAVLAPSRAGTMGDASTLFLVVASFGFGLVATAILHGLLLTTPQPVTFFAWIVALVTVIVALLPFTTSAALETKAATAGLYVVVGLVGGLLLSGAGARARRPGR